jgi:CheY-like chemotaxis protein
MPVMAVTAYAGKGDEERIREAGADAYVAKPISLDEVHRSWSGNWQTCADSRISAGLTGGFVCPCVTARRAPVLKVRAQKKPGVIVTPAFSQSAIRPIT